ncbi:unnamed protein product [Adineta steineri]|uniref:NAD(P)(+)--arginine ADP-ribosyltransferase n=2 Tax=Adineta steineri TaxID=433720 RepID=A0A819WBR2_9BILA|nr:unnamed protein product [Adineta steineri]CAF4122209.1 unnamed protein product [Adineta steineri]
MSAQQSKDSFGSVSSSDQGPSQWEFPWGTGTLLREKISEWGHWLQNTIRWTKSFFVDVHPPSNTSGYATGSGASDTTVTTAPTSTRQRMAQNYLLIWVDESIDETNEDCQNTLTQLRNVVNDVIMCTQSDECIAFLDKHNDENVFVITSGLLAQHLIPEIHDMPKLAAIFIFSDNICYHQQWAKDWKKIKGVHNDIKDICDALKRGVKQVNQDSIPISFVTTTEVVSSENLNQLEPSYMYTQIFKEILLGMEHNHEQAINILTVCWRNLYSDNKSQLVIIDEFERNYRREQAIWWYTRQCFTYEMLNRALRTLDADTIINMGFFIHDLHHQINQLHLQQLPTYDSKPFTVYRGQSLLKSDFDKLNKTKGGLMSFNNFLSTTNDQNVSFMYAESASENLAMVGILFIMTINPRVASTPFASIKEVSYFNTEGEILFSMHTVFRVGTIKKVDNNDQLYEVELQLTADDDEQLRQLTKCISEESGGNTGWKRLSNLLIKTGHFEKAKELYDVLLKQPLNESNNVLYYNNLGYIKYCQGNYEQAIKYYEKTREIFEKPPPVLGISYNNIGEAHSQMGEYSKALSFHENALEIGEKTLPANHPGLATSYNNIGGVYHDMGEYSKALSFYEKAYEIFEKTLPANHPSLATTYNNIGEVYRQKGEYSKALSFHEKALGIREKSLLANHPSLANSYNNIGSVYNNMGEHSKALSFYDKTREIFEKTLPADHPSLAMSHNNIGLIYANMGEHSKALSFFEKALGIYEKTLPANHPSLAMSYNNIGSVYHNMGDYSTALSSFEKALGIYEKTLPANHPDLAISYNNIGGVYHNMGDYSTALSFFEKALGIYEKTLPANHPSLATSYNNIGLMYYKMGEHSKALSFYEKSLGIYEKTLPANHPSLAISCNNIGCVYALMREYSKALSFYEKALGIQEKALPANYPLLAMSYNNIAVMHYNMREYLKALSFYEKALGLQEKTLPENHLDLATSYNNIGTVYDKMGEYLKAISYYERALNILNISLPPNHPHIKTTTESVEIVKKKL